MSGARYVIQPITSDHVIRYTFWKIKIKREDSSNIHGAVQCSAEQCRALGWYLSCFVYQVYEQYDGHL